MGASKQVPTWRVIPVEGGKWKLVQGQNFVSKNGGAITDDNQNIMPSVSELIAEGFQTSLKETGCDGSSQQAIAPQMTSTSVDMPHSKPYCSKFPVNRHNNAHGQLCTRKLGVEQDSNCNVSDPQMSARISPLTIKNGERETVCQKYSRKRPVFKSSFRNVEPTFDHCPKHDDLEKARPTGNASVDTFRCDEGAGEFGAMFKTASGKSVGISSLSLKRARAVLGEDLSSDLIDPETASPQHNSESVGVFQTAAGNPLAVSTSSTKKTQAVVYEDLKSRVMECHGMPVPHTMNETTIMLQTTKGDVGTVPSSSIKRVQSIACEHPATELLKSHDKSVPQTVNKDTEMFDASIENYVTVPSSVSQTKSNFKASAGNSVSVSYLSTKRAENVLEGDSCVSVPELLIKPKSQTINKNTAMFQTAAGNPVTVLPSSIKKPQAILGEISSSEVHKSQIRPTPQKVNTMFQTTPENPVSVPYYTNNKTKPMTSNEHSEIVGHGKPKTMVNMSSTMFQTAAGNCLNTSFVGIKQSETDVQKEKDIQTVQNDIFLQSENDLISIRGSCQTALTFQTTAGKPMAVSKSSVKRALSIISDDDNPGINGGNLTASMFQNIIEKSAEAPLPSDERGVSVHGINRTDKSAPVISEAEDGEEKHKFRLGRFDQPKLYVSNDAAFESINNPTASIFVSGFQTSLKETGCDGSSQQVIAPHMTSTSVDMPHAKPYCLKFPVIGHNSAHGQLCTRKLGVELDSNCNVSDPQMSARISPLTIKNGERETVCHKYSRKRPVFKSSFRNVEPTFDHCSKHDDLEKVRPTGNASVDTLRCDEGAGEFGAMFKTASGKSVGISSLSLKRARAVLGEDLSSDLSHPETASPRHNNESVGVFQTATGNPLAVSTSSTKKTQAVVYEDLKSRVMECHGMPVPHTMNETTIMPQITKGDVGAVTSSSIKRVQSIACEHPAMDLLKSHDKSVPKTVNKDMEMFDASTENYVTLPSSVSQTKLDFEASAGNPVSVSYLSTKRAENILEGDSCVGVPELLIKPKSQTINNTTAMFQTAAGNPVTVLPSSIKKAQAILGECSASEVHESQTRPTPQKADTMFQSTPRNPVSVPYYTNNKTKPMTSNEHSEIVGHGKPKKMVNMSSTVFQTAAGNCLNTSFVGIKQSETDVQKEKDIQTVQNDSFLQSENDLISIRGSCQTALIFQTAAGKPMAVSKSSVKRALSIISDDDNPGFNGGNLTASMFQNTIEKSAEAPLASDERGESVHGINRTDKSDLVISEAEDGEEKHKFRLGRVDQPKLYESNDTAFESMNNPTGSIFVSGQIAEESKFAVPKTHSHHSLFQTGSGKPVNISMSSISKAKALLESDSVEAPIANKTYETHNGPASVFCDSTSDQSSFVSGRAPTITASCHGKANSGPNQMHQFTFQTAAGRSVNVSTKSMKRAMDLLGDEVNKNTAGMNSLGDLESNTVVSSGPPPLLFQTGAGRSVSISSAAMKRARNLLGEMSVTSDSQRLSVGFSDSSAGSERHCNEVVSNKESVPFPSHASGAISSEINSVPTDAKRLSAGFGIVSAVRPPRTPKHCHDAVSNKENLPYASHVSGVVSPGMNSAISKLPHVAIGASFEESMLVSGNFGARKLGKRKVCISPLAEISNKSPLCHYDNHFQQPTITPTVHKSMMGSKRGLFRSRYVTPFKQPRRSMFSSPYDERPKSAIMEPSLSVQSFPQGAPCEVKFHFRYPSSQKRKTIQEYFGGPPHHQQALWHLSTEIQAMTADVAQHYKFHAKSCSGYDNLASGDFQKMLLQSGADPRHATIEWVENHYKWIVWKLACIERSYARKAGGKYLTVQNVLEELKYRYEREVNRSHRSPLKKIIEGDAAAARMMVLCVSAVRVWPNQEQNDPSAVKGSMEVSKESENCTGNAISNSSSSNHAKIELTDGWYCLNAILDEPLSEQLLHGKLFVGQKLRICGASLHGWVGPLSPLEAFQTVSLVLHINGTYRAHWAERLSFCRSLPVPLAFRCIKEGGGPVPRTLVGVMRIYPTLYKERLANRAYIIRSERAEDKTLHLYNERRTHIVEDIILKAEKEKFHSSLDSNRDEGAHLYSVLENASEPELIMADMTSAQLSAFAAYQSKREAIRQTSIEKNIQKALEDADMDSRKVTPFMRVRIIGLTRKCISKTEEKAEMGSLLKREGLVTIWQPTENQVLNLEEGAIYCVSGLVPLVGKSGDSYSRNVLQFQANRSTLWHRIPPSMCRNFEFAYSPRSALLLSDLGKVPLHSEFDVAVFVLHVGEPFTYGFRKRQWLFASDGSVELDCWSKQSEIILAIDFSLPCDSFIAFDNSLAGSTVGLCNLVKQKQDQNNSLWVVEMTESSIHSVNFNAASFCHLKAAAESVDNWAKVSVHAVEKLSERVSDIVRNTI